MKPHRAILWENAGQVVGEKTAETALAVAIANVPCCASRVSNLTKVLRRVPREEEVS